MIQGSAVINPAVLGGAERWFERARRGVRVDSRTKAASPLRSWAGGARMDEEAIRQCVERARRGEHEAAGELFDAFRSDVQKLCTRLVGPIDAEDALSEVFERAQQKLETYDQGQPFRRWLLSIASHRCIDRLRRKNVEKRLFDDTDSDGDDFAAGSRTALDGLIQAEEQAAVQRALDRLPDHYRVPLVLRYFLDLGYDEIGETMGVKRSQVASLLFRGKQSLRTLLYDMQEGRS